MVRKAAYHVRLADGREVGFGLVLRCGDTYSVQFADLSGKSLIRSTRETARPRAIAAAEQIVRDHWEPKSAPVAGTTWDEVSVELERHLIADAARPATVSDYLDTVRQVRTAAVAPAAVTVEATAAVVQRILGRHLSAG